MDTSIPINPNPIISDTVLGSNYFNPGYWFSQGLSLFYQFIDFINNYGTSLVSTLNTLLLFLALFFLAVIFYSSVRLLEIRRKEHKHLEHEIAEYAHRQAEK